ncbi:MAG: hypothetical protein QW039_05845 [Fervidicoccaceae archaeon]
MSIEIRRERSKSKSGKHAYYENAFYVSRSEVREIDPLKKRNAPPLYKEGESTIIQPKPPRSGEVIVKVRLVRNPRGRVKGIVDVIDENGRILLRMKYNKLKFRRSIGSAEFAWAVKNVASHLKLPIRRFNLKTGVEDDRNSAS